MASGVIRRWAISKTGCICWCSRPVLAVCTLSACARPITERCDIMKRKPNPELIDHENPEWTAADFRRARPAAEVLPRLIGKQAAARLLKPRGRPKSPDAKVSISLRIPPETLALWKSGPSGWRTALGAAFAQAPPRNRRRI